MKQNNKVKTHIRYKTKEGVIVPGVTTILNKVLAKPALIHWAWDLGCKGIDYKVYRDDKADIGTLAHEMILCHLKKENVDTSFYTQNQIDLAETCFLKYLDWEKGKKIEPILLEKPLISENYQYGGTLDMFCILDDIPTLIDFKTSKGIYEEMLYQIGAYNNLILENNEIIPKQYFILRIGRNEEEGFEVRKINNLTKYFEIFKYCLSIYNLKKEVKRS